MPRVILDYDSNEEMVLEGNAAEEALYAWSGFIAPDGTFYGARPEGMLTWKGTASWHELIAQRIIRKQWLQESPTRAELMDGVSYKDKLVFRRGWLSVGLSGSAAEYCQYPLGCIAGNPRMTGSQQTTLFLLWKRHGLDLREYFRVVENAGGYTN